MTRLPTCIVSLFLVLVAVGGEASENQLALLVGPDLDARWHKQKAQEYEVLKRIVLKWEEKHRPADEWSPDVLRAFELEARQISGMVLAKEPDAQIGVLLADMISRGCQDPAIRYLHLRELQDPRIADPTVLVDLLHAFNVRETTPYLRMCCARRLLVALDKNHVRPDDHRYAEALDMAKKASVDLFATGTNAEIMKVVTINVNIVDFLSSVWDVLLVEQWRDALLAGCDQSATGKWWKNYIIGETEIKLAWAYRGNGWGRDVTDRAAAEFQHHLALARQAFVGAWQVDPTNGYAASGMITVSMGDRSGEEDAWFARSISQNPFNDRAYWSYSEAIKPKWGGSIDKMLTVASDLARMDVRDAPMFDYAFDIATGGFDLTTSEIFRHPRCWPILKQAMDKKRSSKKMDASDVDGYYLALAWVCNQKEEAAVYWTRIGGKNVTTQWVLKRLRLDGRQFEEDCRKWSEAP